MRAERRLKFFCCCVAAAEKPSPPLNLSFSDQIKTAVTLTWDTPLSNGGSMITGYIVEKCDDGADKWLRCNARLCPDLSYRVGSSPSHRLTVQQAAASLLMTAMFSL